MTHRQLAAVGIRGSAIARRVAQGRLVRLYRGVFAVGHVPRTEEARWLAAVMACGPGSVLSHLDAAALWRVYASRSSHVHVTTTTRTPRELPGVRAHRTRRLHPDEVTTRDGIPVTTVARTLVDLTDVLGRDRLLRAIREAEYLGLLDLDPLNAAVERAHGRQRLGALKRALVAHRPGQIVRDELEHRFLELIRRANLPEPETNVAVETKRRTYTVDCLWREHGVVVELDGRAAHARAEAFERDRERDAALSATGLRTVRFTWRRVKNESDQVTADLANVLARATLSG